MDIIASSSAGSDRGRMFARKGAGGRGGRSRRAVRAVTITAAFALLAGACGGEMTAPVPAPTMGSVAGANGHAGAVGSTVDASRALHAEAYVLPAGAATASFDAKPQTVPRGAREASAHGSYLARCLKQPLDTFATGLAETADGYVFTNSTGRIESFASVFATAGPVATHTMLVRGSDYVRCLGQGLDERLDSATQTWALQAATAVPTPRNATRHVSLRFQRTSGGQTQERYVDIILVYAGRVESMLAFDGYARHMDPGLLQATTNQIVAEVANQ
jgi:hypothetical protein